MGKARMYGMYKPYTPNNKDDRKRTKMPVPKPSRKQVKK